MGFKFLSFFTSSEPVPGDFITVIAAIEKIKQVAIEFDHALKTWDGGMFGALALVRRANDVTGDTHRAAALVETCPNFTVEEAHAIADVTQAVADKVGDVIDTVAGDKAKFTRVKWVGNLAAIALIRRVQQAAEALAAAIIPRAPDEVLPLAQHVSKQFGEHFARGIAVYESDEDDIRKEAQIIEEKMAADLNPATDVAQIKT